ncbi:MBL fold metallo-hydrolase [Clostridium sp. CX1]|uniref:MBL fold metallo-hydrolase n=1 Tax=Clostridium sp. CX1 TaxID=2978346 RepID=UPI0021C12EED|nr:MBL fold metallo-hydrolase [Clostridium sp. CX1]MCT8976123.1 MBL fold metallo-hydrolase [Clostridium sp. CX1]
MNKSKIKIYYIFHSGFAVETENHFLVLDYYMSPKELGNNGPSKFSLQDSIKNKNNVLVFSSHSHEDHFNTEILDWEKINPSIKYLLGSDIPVDFKKSNYYKLSKYEEIIFKFKDDLPHDHKNNGKIHNSSEVYVKAYGSTDIGISFLIRVDGLTLFHAGDLNWWHWKDDSLEERSLAEKNFKLEIEKIKDENIDIAFFPVDPRLEEHYSSGGEYFIKELKPKFFIPMHFGDNCNITKTFAEKVKELPTKVVIINSSGEELSL